MVPRGRRDAGPGAAELAQITLHTSSSSAVGHTRLS